MIFSKYIKIYKAEELVYLIVNTDKNFIQAETGNKKSSLQDLKK